MNCEICGQLVESWHDYRIRGVAVVHKHCLDEEGV